MATKLPRELSASSMPYGGEAFCFKGLEPHAAVDLDIAAVDEVVFHQALDGVCYFIRLTDAAGTNHGL